MRAIGEVPSEKERQQMLHSERHVHRGSQHHEAATGESDTPQTTSAPFASCPWATSAPR
jgi:hypothetical protein